MLLYTMLYIVLAYLMLFAALSNSVCLNNAFFFSFFLFSFSFLLLLLLIIFVFFVRAMSSPEK